MITILAVGAGAEQLAAFGASHPSVEIVTSEDAEDALERLARNRRIDAVLILDSPGAAETARLVREEDPGAPPLFAPAAAGPIAGVSSLEARTAAEMLEAVVAALGPGS